jgi:hypothetical protein
VLVRVLVCWEDAGAHFGDREYVNWPVHVCLERPLGTRLFIEVDDEQVLPLFAPDS